MYSVLTTLFSYIFMVSSFTAIVSVFALVLIAVRYFVGATSSKELEIAYSISIILAISLILLLISLFLSERFSKSYKDVDVDL